MNKNSKKFIFQLSPRNYDFGRFFLTVALKKWIRAGSVAILLGTLRSHDREGNGNVKNAIG